MLTDLHDVVGWTLHDAEGILQTLQLRPETRPDDFAQKSIEIRGNQHQLRSAGWTDERGTLNGKYCRMQSTKVDVAIMMIYPTTRPDLLPVFGAEWVVVGDRCHLAVLDVHPAGNHPELDRELTEVFGTIGERWQKEMPTVPDSPEWFREIAKPWAIFSRCTVDRVKVLREAYREYLQAAVDMFFQPRQPDCVGGADAESVVRYKRRQFDHSPGRDILRTTFGAEYAEAFLRWHCGPPHQTLQQTAGHD